MKIAVLGTGMVGHTIATKLVALGHDVMMGSRTGDNPKAAAWVRKAGGHARAGTFAEAAAFGELVFNCTHGANSLAALSAAGATQLQGKVIVDVANVLPVEARGTESLGEQIQKAFPLSKVVKTLNTVNCEVMVDPGKLKESHTVFLSGNDESAKQSVRAVLTSFGWTDVLDLGEIVSARATEGYLPLWLALWRTLGTTAVNIKVVR